MYAPAATWRVWLLALRRYFGRACSSPSRARQSSGLYGAFPRSYRHAWLCRVAPHNECYIRFTLSLSQQADMKPRAVRVHIADSRVSLMTFNNTLNNEFNDSSVLNSPTERTCQLAYWLLEGRTSRCGVSLYSTLAGDRVIVMVTAVSVIH
jgi:hypothetical protein